jgi:glycosyltransferase involved in cell wall biosynthesis
VRLEIQPRRGVLATLKTVMARVSALRSVLRREHPRVVLSFIAENNVMALLAARGGHWRIVVSERVQPAVDETLGLTWRVLRYLTYRQANCVVAQTQSAASWLRAHARVAAEVIPNALRELPASGVERESLVLAIGRLTRQKGFDLLLEAFARIRGEFPAWRLVILGQGPERQVLAAQCAALGLGDIVDMPGVERNVEGWLARAGVVVQPSRFEGFPNVILEAMGMGAAVVSADCEAGPAELIEDGVNGRLVPVEDVSGLAAALRELLASREKRERLGTAALAVRETYRTERIMNAWGAVLFGAPRGGEPT